MDAMLRARHDALIAEFPCTATELRIVKTPPGSALTRSIDALCNDPRSARFGNTLVSYQDFCAGCLYLQLAEEDGDLLTPLESEVADG
jgi:hypothetical protein